MKAIREARLIGALLMIRCVIEKPLFSSSVGNNKCTSFYPLVFNWDEAEYQHFQKDKIKAPIVCQRWDTYKMN